MLTGAEGGRGGGESLGYALAAYEKTILPMIVKMIE
jgi:hypothetical protein